MADIRCPMCGKQNPSELVVCQYCQARLTPLQDTAPDSASTIPMDGQPGQSGRDKGETKSPDWLSSLRTGDESAETGPSEQEELPDWIDEFREKPDDSESDLSHDWLPDDSGDADSSSVDWLDRIRKATTASVSDDVNSQSGDLNQDEEPDWMLRSGADPLEETRDEDELSDWLSQLDQPKEDEQPIPPVLEPTQNEAGEEDDSSVISDWMGEPVIQDAPDLSSQAENGGILDWLERSAKGDDAESGKALDSEASGISSQPPQADSSIADADVISKWLEELGQDEIVDETTPSGRGMADLGDVPEGSQPAGPDEVEQEDWLSQIDTARSASSSTDDDASEPELPDWLATGMQETPDHEAEPLDVDASSYEKAGEQEDIDKLSKEFDAASSQDDGLEKEELSTPSDLPESQGEISEWLSLEGIEPHSGSDADAGSQEISEDVPDWLQEALQASKSDLDEIEAGDIPAAVDGQISPPESIPDFSPDELDDTPIDSEDESISQMIGLAATARAMADESHPEEGDLDWLQELEEAFSESSIQADESASGEEHLMQLEPAPDDALPDWLSQAQDTDDVADEPPLSIAEEPNAELSPADLPSWLEAMRPVAALDEEEDTEEREGVDEVEGAGPLAGLHGILPAEPDIARTGKPPAFSSKLLVTESQQVHMKMLEGLLKVEAEAQPIPAGPLVTSQLVLRSIVGVVLLAAILLPMLLGVPQVSLPVFTTETFELSQMVTNLPADAPVLMAVDYQPGLSGEMDAVAGAVVDHLMLKGSYLAIVSTTHTGPVQAEHLLIQVNAAGGHQYESPANYTNLGFIPAGSSGILGFAQSPRQILPNSIDSEPAWENPTLQAVNSLADFAMLVVATENPETAKAWIEQVQPLRGDTPLVLVTSAQAEPMVRPYYEAQPRQIQGLLSGLVSSSEYQILLGRSGSSGDYWAAFSIGTLAALALIVLGAIYFLTSARLTRNQDRDEDEA